MEEVLLVGSEVAAGAGASESSKSWAGLLETCLRARDVRLVNKAVPKRLSPAEALGWLKRLVPSHYKPAVVMWALSLEDCEGEDWTAKRGEFVQGARSAAEHAREHGAAAVVCSPWLSSYDEAALIALRMTNQAVRSIEGTHLADFVEGLSGAAADDEAHLAASRAADAVLRTAMTEPRHGSVSLGSAVPPGNTFVESATPFGEPSSVPAGEWWLGEGSDAAASTLLAAGSAGAGAAESSADHAHHGGSHRAYMETKRRKLDDQNARPLKSTVLRDVVAWFDGIGDDRRLKELVLENGGSVVNTMHSTVTHIVCEALADNKMNTLADKVKSKRHVVKPSYLDDSVRAGKLLQIGPRYAVLPNRNGRIDEFLAPAHHQPARVVASVDEPDRAAPLPAASSPAPIPAGGASPGVGSVLDASALGPPTTREKELTRCDLVPESLSQIDRDVLAELPPDIQNEQAARMRQASSAPPPARHVRRRVDRRQGRAVPGQLRPAAVNGGDRAASERNDGELTPSDKVPTRLSQIRQEDFDELPVHIQNELKAQQRRAPRAPSFKAQQRRAPPASEAAAETEEPLFAPETCRYDYVSDALVEYMRSRRDPDLDDARWLVEFLAVVVSELRNLEDTAKFLRLLRYTAQDLQDKAPLWRTVVGIVEHKTQFMVASANYGARLALGPWDQEVREYNMSEHHVACHYFDDDDDDDESYS